MPFIQDNAQPEATSRFVPDEQPKAKGGGAFDDLIPRPSTGAFDDLIPKPSTGAFDDLIPKQAETKPKNRTWFDVAGDTAIDVAKGVVGLGEGVVGMTDLATGNMSGKGWGELGFDPERTKKILGEFYSDSRKEANASVSSAKGFIDTTKALIDNPSVAVGSIAESAPMMLATAAAVRTAAAKMLASRGYAVGSAQAAEFLAKPAVIARLTAVGSAAEGALTAGGIQEQGRQAGRDYTDTAPEALAAGAMTAAIGYGTSKIPGFRDAETGAALAGMGGQKRQGLLTTGKEIAKGMFKEGVLEEMPQSAQEQIFTNVALGKPWDEGVAEAAAQGMVTGAGMGGGMNTYEAGRNALAAKPNPSAVPGVSTPTPEDAPVQVIPAQQANTGNDSPQARTLRTQRPEARLAELDILRSTRGLTEVEVSEGIDLLQGMKDERAKQESGDSSTLTSPPESSGDGVSSILTRPPDPAPLEPTQAPAEEPAGRFVPDDFQSGDRVQTAQGITGTLKIRDGMTYVIPDTVEGGAPGTNGQGLFSVAPGEVAHTNEPAPLPSNAPTSFWAYAKQRGFIPREIKVGTPVWSTLKADFESAKAAHAQSSASILPTPVTQGGTANVTQTPQTQQTAPQGPAPAAAAAAAAAAAVTPPASPAIPDPSLQNRDRSRAASVAQMSEIARNPDYMRLGTSRTPDAGAPMVFAVGDVVGNTKIPSGNEGHQDIAVMSDGSRVPFRYAVVSANDVEPSNFADGRSNPVFASNVPGTIKALNNGRTAGLRAAYEMGTAGTYQQELIADAAAHGVPVEAIQRTPNPILVRAYLEASNTQDMAAKSQGQGLGMSPTELASQDAPLIDSSVLSVYQQGDVTSPANRDFVRAFVGQLRKAGQDVAGLMTAEGTLSPAGRQRIQAALMQNAFGDADLVSELFDSLDTEIKGIGEALKTVAGEWANMRDSARQEHINPEADITPNMVQAVNLIRKARRERTSLYDLTHQVDLMTGETPDPLTVGALRLFYTGEYLTRAHGRDAVVSALRDYVRTAMGTAAGADMFGQTVSPSNILDSINQEGKANVQDQTQEGSRGTDGSGNHGRSVDQAREADQRWGSTEPSQGTGADRPFERENAAGTTGTGNSQADQGNETAQLSAQQTRNEDVGAQLYANRRNFTGRGIQWGDVAELNDTLKLKEVTKAKVWPRPNYEQLVADGMPALLARLVKQVYDSISSGPTLKANTAPSDEDLKHYIDTLAKVREGLFNFVNDKQAVGEFAGAVVALTKGSKALAGPIAITDMLNQSVDAKAISETLLRRIWPQEYQQEAPAMRRFGRGTQALAEINAIGGNKPLTAMQFARDDFAKWAKDLGKGWPGKREAWEVQGYKVLEPSEYTVGSPFEITRHHKDTGNSEPTGETSYSVRAKEGRGSWHRKGQAFTGDKVLLVQDGGFSAQEFDTKDQAIEAAREKVKRSASTGQDLRGTNIEDADRTGPARRKDGEDITSQRLMDTFGFRGVNFGREAYIKQAERQAYLNQTYDGLLDLAEILGVPPKAMSLDGKLGIAFGAQGNGRFAAHFVPGKNEINLTKTRGAGTLAHEWGHGLDHYFATQAGLEKSTEPMLSEHASKGDTTSRVVLQDGKYVNQKDVSTFGDGIRPEIVQAFRDIRQAMEKRNESEGEAKMRRDAVQASALKSLDGWLKAARRVIEGSNAENKAELLAEFDQHAEKFREGDTGDGYQQSGKQAFSARVAAVRNLIKDATGRLWSNDETKGLEANARYVRNLIGKQEADTAHEAQQVATQFKRDSLAVDKEKGGKAYWSTPTEMFARAFELYIHDKLSQSGNRNTFLTDADERASNPLTVADNSSAMARGSAATRDLYVYPVGQEREALRNAFDSLVGQIKTKETEQGVAIYSTTGRSVPLPTGQRITETTIADEIEKRMGQFAHQPTIVIRDSAEGVLPGATKADGIAGAVHQGRIYLFRDQISTRADVQETLFHEVFHYGVRKIFTRSQFIQEMQALYGRDAWVKARADAWVKTAEGKAAARHGGDEYALARGVDEALARLAEPNAGSYTRTDEFSRAVVNVTRWLADLAERLGFTGYAAKLRGIKNEEARALVQQVFNTLQTQEHPEHAGWLDDAEPAFSRNTIGGQEPDPIEPGQQNAWTKAKAKMMELTSAEAIDKLIYEFQDKYIDLKRLRDHIKAIGGTITDLNDAYLSEELFHARLGKRSEDFLDKELKPLLAEMRSRSVSMKEMESYLHARHAPEANRVLAERNPNRAMIDAEKDKANKAVRDLELKLQKAEANGSATKAIEDALLEARGEAARWNGSQAFRGDEGKRLALSGMSDLEAKAYMDSLTPRKRQNLEELATRVDAIQSKTLDTLADYGLMDKATLNAWRSTYEFYVPLHRDEAKPESNSHPIGQGFSVKGKAAKSRTGSNEKVTNILAHIAMQREAALTRGEKNLVVKKLFLMAAQNPDSEFWEIDKPPQIKTIDPNTGFVRTGIDPGYKSRPNVVMVRIAGNDQAIVFNEHNQQAVRLATSIKNLDIGDLHVVLGLASKGTRWFASVNTQYNPIFGVINFMRDVGEGMVNLSTTPIAGKQLEVSKGVFSAMRAVYRQGRGKGSASAANKAWMDLWEDFQNIGGPTGYRDLYAGVDDRMKALEKELTALDRGEVSQAAHAVVDWLSDYNEAFENSVRLSAYKVALDSGMTKERAASLAKNLTVNFNRKGRHTPEIGALYAFFNAAIQGTARMAETLKGPMGKKIMLGGVMLGVVNTLVGMAMMGGGDGEDDDWDKIPDFIKERSLIIPLGHKDYVSIPMPLGFKLFPNIGRLAVEFALGGKEKTVGKTFGGLLTALADTFNPLGGAQNLGQMVAPTVIDPVVALMQNRDWTGKPIYRENSNGLNPQPGHKMVKDSASTVGKGLSKAINAITGGTEYRPGMWSPSPDSIDYVFGQLTGGLGRELLKVNQTIASTVTGDELPPYKIPLVGRLYGNTRGTAGQSEKFYEHLKLLNELESEFRGRQRNSQDADGFRKSEPLVELVALGNGSERMVSKLRKMRTEVTERKEPGYQARVKDIDKQIGDAMTRLNNEVDKVRNFKGKSE